VVIVDDLLATGGSAFAAVQLVKQMKGNVLKCMFLIELSELEGPKKVGYPCFSLFQF
jgi:adenine phosphoribosyltransferase